MSHRAIPLLTVLLACCPLPGAAQDFERDVLQPDAFEGDPLGIGEVGDLDDVQMAEPAPAPDTEEPPPEVAVREGEVVRAVPAVREKRHRVEVKLVAGLAVTRHTSHLLNVGSHDVPVRYRLAVPAGAEVAGCEGCRTRWIRDDRGVALEVDVQSLPSKEEAQVTLTYVAAAPQAGGAVRWALPARGSDPRAARAEVTVDAPHLLSPKVDGVAADDVPVPVDPWRPAEVTALRPTADPPRATLWHFPCDGGHCARLHAVAGPRSARPRDVLLLVDASPSTIGPARNRMGVALTALLGIVPGGSRVRAVAFAGDAKPVLADPTPPDRVPLRPLVDATRAELGSSTRLEAAWSTVGSWVQDSRGAGRDPQVVLVGDGGLTWGADAEATVAEAEHAGVAIHAVNVSDRPARPSLVDAVRRTGGLMVSAGDAAARAERGDTPAPLEERLRVLFAPDVVPELELRKGRERTALGPLRAGEQRAWEGPVRARPVLKPGGLLRARPRPAPAELVPALARRVQRTEASRPVHDLTSSDPAPPIATLDAPPDHPLDGKGIPKATVRTMLRQRLVPPARLCFRQDRRGRADHARRAEFVLRLAEREIMEARVEGDLPQELRRCLLAAVDALDVPYFEGVVIVRYPVYTQRAPEEPSVELEAPVRHQVDAVTQGHPTTPRTP